MLVDFPPYAFYVMHFDVPSILCVWGIINISGDIWFWDIIISIHVYSMFNLLLLYLSYWCLTVYCILSCIVQHLNMTLCSNTIGEDMPVRGERDRSALCTSAFCNVTFSWCSRVLYTWAWLARVVRSAFGYVCIVQCHTVLL